MNQRSSPAIVGRDLMTTGLTREPSWRPLDQLDRAVTSPADEGAAPDGQSPSGHAAGPAPPSVPAPMGISSVLRISAGLLRRHWLKLLAISVILVAPASLLLTWTTLQYDAVVREVYGLGSGLWSELPAVSLTQHELDRLNNAEAAISVTSFIESAFLWIAGLGFAAIVAADYFKRPASTGAALRVTARRSISAVVVGIAIAIAAIALTIPGVIVVAIAWGTAFETDSPSVISLLVLAGAVAVFIAVVYLVLRLGLVLPVLAVEGIGWWAALNRSWVLTAKNVLRTFAVSILAFIATLLVTIALWTVMYVAQESVASALGVDQFLFESLAGVAILLLVTPIAPVVWAVLYFDLRSRLTLRPSTPPKTQWGLGGS